MRIGKKLRGGSIPVISFPEPETSFLHQCKKGGVNAETALRQTDLTGTMEGIYIKVEAGDYVTDRG